MYNSHSNSSNLTLNVKNCDKSKNQKIFTVTFSRYISIRECKLMLSEILSIFNNYMYVYIIT